MPMQGATRACRRVALVHQVRRHMANGRPAQRRLSEKERRDLANAHRGEVEVGSAVALEPKRLAGQRHEYGIRRKADGLMHRTGMTEDEAVAWMATGLDGMDPWAVFELVRRPIGDWEAVAYRRNAG
jgi:hypothetical protein